MSKNCGLIEKTIIFYEKILEIAILSQTNHGGLVHFHLKILRKKIVLQFFLIGILRFSQVQSFTSSD